MAYTASVVLGNELNVKAVVYICRPPHQSRWRLKVYIVKIQAIAPFIFSRTRRCHAPEIKFYICWKCL